MAWNQIAVNIGIALGSALLMWALSPRPQAEARKAQSFTSQNFPRAREGQPVPLVLGTALAKGPNVIWLDDLKTRQCYPSHAHIVEFGSVSTSTTPVTECYDASFALALCLGPDVHLKRIWAQKDILWTEGVDEAGKIQKTEIYGGHGAGGGISSEFDFHTGSRLQQPNTYIQKFFPHTPAYRGISYIVFKDAYIGESPNLRPLSFELQRFTNGLNLPNNKNIIGEDLNAAELLYQVLTLDWGAGAFSHSDLDLASFVRAGETLYDEGFGLSVNIDTPNQVQDVVSELLKHVDGVLYQDHMTGKLVLKLIRDDYNKETLLELTPDNVIKVRNFSHGLWAGTKNQVRVTFVNRERKYSESNSIAQNVLDFSNGEKLSSHNVSFPYCMEPSLAAKIAARELSQVSAPLSSFTLEVNRQIGELLSPADVVSFVWPDYKIERIYLRVVSVNKGSLTDGIVTIEAVQELFAVSNTVYSESAEPVPSVMTQKAFLPEGPLIQEVPYALSSLIYPTPSVSHLGKFVQFHSFARRRNDQQSAYTVLMYEGSARGPVTIPYPRSARLSEAIPKMVFFDSSLPSSLLFGIKIQDLDFDVSLIKEATKDERRLGANLILIGDEYFSFQRIQDNDDGTYDLLGVYGGLMDTIHMAHEHGAVVYFVIDHNPLTDSMYRPSVIKEAELRGRTSKDVSDPLMIDVAVTHRTYAPLRPIKATVSRDYNATLSGFSYDVSWQEQSRLLGEIAFDDDPPEMTGQEPGVTYDIFYKVDGVVKSSSRGIAGTRKILWPPVEPDEIADRVLSIYAVRDGVRSYTSCDIFLGVDRLPI